MLLVHRYQTVKTQITEEVEQSFSGFKTANRHLVTLLSQRLSLLTRSLGLLNYVNDETELTLVSLATEWQRISKDVNLEGDFYYIHRDGRVDLVLSHAADGYELNWGASVNPAVIDYLKSVNWRGEGEISSQVVEDADSGENLYIIFIPVFDKWSKLVGWMVNEYNQTAINNSVNFVGQQKLVERAMVVSSDGLIIEGENSQATVAKLKQFVGKINYSALGSYFSRGHFAEEQSPLSLRDGLLYSNVFKHDLEAPSFAFLFISYKDLARDSKYWLVFMAGVGLIAIVACFVAAYLTEAIRREKAIVEELNALREAAFEGEFSQVIIDKQGIVLQVNRYLAQRTGLSVEEMIGHDIASFGQAEPSFHTMLEQAELHGSWLGEVSISDANGQVTIQQMTVTAVYWQEEVRSFVCSSIDISAQKSLEKKLQRLANTDPLTGAANRRHFEHLVHLEQSRSDRNGVPFSLLMFDVDHFKKLNDQHGHDVGDLCLIRLVEKVNQLKREIDILARWGGEEFILLLPETTVEQAVNLAERLRLGFEQDVVSPHFTCSFGLTESRKDASFSRLYKQADEALYHAKEAGRNRVELYRHSAKNS